MPDRISDEPGFVEIVRGACVAMHDECAFPDCDCSGHAVMRDVIAADRRHCAELARAAKNALWGGQFQLGYDAAKKDIAEAIERGEPE